jgi:4-amino-4-deoxy-L-arabinose transferase-like glycosyltransferase
MTPRHLAILVLGLEALVVIAGQFSRDLMTMDDLREAEVAREMAADGSYVVPHLAGLPFVEKPPGFPAVVATLFTLLGRPSVLAARLVAAAFALAALGSVYLLGRSVFGMKGGILASAFLAFSPLFIRVSHEILLDNALLAAMGWALYFLWSAVSENELGRKRRAYSRAAFLLGVAFLIKGLVGPSLAASGFLAFVLLSRRWSELRAALHPYPAAAFLAPCLVWILPFLKVAPPELVGEFFVKNQFGRFSRAYASHSRPFYFYLQTTGYKLGAAVLCLPFAWVAAWRDRIKPEGASGLFFFAFSIGPLLLLSISSAKDAIYLLPVYPAFSLAAAGWSLKAFATLSPAARVTGVLGLLAGAGTALVALVKTAQLGGFTAGTVLAGAAVLSLRRALVVALRQRVRAIAGAGVTGLFAVAALLWQTGPIAGYEMSRELWRGPLPAVLQASEGKDLVLFRPDDETRGAYGFYRARTAQEIADPVAFVRRLAAGRETLGSVLWSGPALPEDLLKAARGLPVDLVDRLRARYYSTDLILLAAGP